jgi:hypothetical protein
MHRRAEETGRSRIECGRAKRHEMEVEPVGSGYLRRLEFEDNRGSLAG